MSRFFRYPQTPHLAWLGSSPPRDDKVLDGHEVVQLLEHEIIVEEKLDGANVGISVDSSGTLKFQNRGQFLEPPYTGQFTRLNGWAAEHGRDLAAALVSGLILFGEWLAARHSVEYDNLPDWFVAFDIYDAGDGAFWSAVRRDKLVSDIGLPIPPCLLNGRSTLPDLTRLVMDGRSKFGDTPLEGIIVRQDTLRVNVARAKLVRPDFAQSMEEHWRRRALRWNKTGSA